MAVEHEAFLAKRIASWTTKSLLSAMVLVAGLGVGRQVLKWWSDGSRESAPLPTPFQQDDGLGDASRVHILQFGDQCWSIRRQTVVGRVADAAGALRAACRETIAGAQPAGSQPTEAERQFLAKLGRQRPVEEKPGEWQLFQWNEDVPMLVGVRPWPPSSPVGAGTPLAEPGRRVVLWGLAIPAEPGNWTLMAFQPEAGTDSSRDVFPEIPLPPDAKRLISIRVAGGGSVTAFTALEVPEAWSQFYDRWAARQGWTSAEGWQRTAAGRNVEYVSTQRSPPVAVDIRIGQDAEGRCTGLMAVGGGR